MSTEVNKKIRKSRYHSGTREETEIEILRQTSSKFQALIETTIDFIWELDREARFTYCSPQMEKLWGIKPESMIGRTPFDTMPARVRDKYKNLFRKAVETPVPFTNVESIAQTISGTPVWIESNGVPFFDDKGNLMGYRGIARDITRRKKSEKALKEKDKQLRRTKKALERTQAQLMMTMERLNDDLIQFSNVAAHDLQEPLRLVSSYTQLLQQKYADKLDEDANEYIKYAVEGSRRMYELINGLLSYTRIPVTEKNLEPVDMNEIMGSVLNNLAPLIEKTKTVITCGKLPEVYADGKQMIQLLHNLIENAIKFSRGVPKIKISSGQEGIYEVFSVRDEGIGIEPQYYQKIFRIFQKLHRKEDYMGTGIGLAICKRIVERHKGKIWVYSRCGEGSTFFFSIPSIQRKAENYWH